MVPTIRADHVLCVLVDTLLPRRGTWKRPNERALYVKVCIDLFAYTDEADFQERVYLHFVILRQMNYTRVYSTQGDHGLPALDQFKMTANHDSCWREGFTQPLRVAREHVIEIMEEHPVGDRARNTFPPTTTVSGVEFAVLEDETTDPSRPHMKTLQKLTLLGDTATHLDGHIERTNQ